MLERRVPTSSHPDKRKLQIFFGVRYDLLPDSRFFEAPEPHSPPIIVVIADSGELPVLGIIYTQNGVAFVLR